MVLEKPTRFLLEATFRTVPGPALVAVVFFSALFTNYFLKAVGVPGSFIEDNLKPLTLGLVKENAGRAFALFMVLFISNFLLDVFATALSNKVQRTKIYLLKRLSFPSWLIDNLKNTTTISVRELDEFVKGIYDRSQGKIVLYNPDPSMFAVSTSSIRLVIENKLKQKSIEKLKIITSTHSQHIFESFKASLDPNLRGSVDIDTSDTDLNGPHAQFIERHAVYYSSSGAGSYDIYYFMYRPVRPPYQDEYVIIKKGIDLKTLRSGYEYLYQRI